MKVYRALLGMVLFFIVIYAFRGYLNNPQYGFNYGSNKIASSTLGTSTDNSGSSTVASENLDLSILNKIKGLDSSVAGYSANRDTLSPVVGKTNSISAEGKLTDDGVFFDTNEERVKQGLPALKRNSVLDKSAEIKLNDMFSNQYFEHVSPSGSSVSNVVNFVGYQFLIIGENLALGNFAGDSKVVAAWMASEGHRANILDKRYTEMGVAVRYGMYKGQKQWLAVQHFARPMSSCSSPSVGLKDRISKDKEELVLRENDITTMKKTVDKTESIDPNFQSIISNYNILVNDYNSKLKNLKTEIANYNSQVNNFNTCLDAVTTTTS